jgi:hypothetical protein
MSARRAKHSVSTITSDEDLAMEFLTGLVNYKPGGQQLEAGSKRESEGQKALLRLLRNNIPLSSTIRWRLAALLDPAQTTEAREFVIKPRRKGKQPNHPRDVEIARDIAAAIAASNGRRGAKETAIRDATKRYGVARPTVIRAWEKHGDFWLKPHRDNKGPN